MNADTVEHSSFEKLNIPENIKTNSPMDFFKLYFTDDVCAEIVKWTNLASSAKILQLK